MEIDELLFDTAHSVSNFGVSRALKRNMYGQLNRIKDVEHLRLDGAGDNGSVAVLDGLSPLMFWSITLLLKRHLFTYTPSEILYPAEVIIDLLHKQTESPVPTSSPFHHHFLAIAVITLLEITDLPELARDAWKSLEKALQVFTLRDKHSETAGEFENVFATQSWNASFLAFIEAKLNDHRANQQEPQPAAGTSSSGGGTAPPLVGPTEQRSLQHLADLAVGAGGGPGNAASPPPASADNAPGEEKDPASSATAGVAEGLPVWPNEQAKQQQQQQRTTIDFTRLTRKGYLNVFAGL